MSDRCEPSRWWMRRFTIKDGKSFLIWHAYESAEKRDKMAGKYRLNGDKVWLSADGSSSALHFLREEDALV